MMIDTGLSAQGDRRWVIGAGRSARPGVRRDHGRAAAHKDGLVAAEDLMYAGGWVAVVALTVL